MNRYLSMLLIVLAMSVVLVTTETSPVQAQVPAGPNRPPDVPEGYVITPSGYFHPSCVRQLGDRETLLAGGRVLQHADGALENIPACSYPHYTAGGEIVATGGARVEPPTIDHSFLFASATTNASYGELTATWTVPLGPINNDGQTLYFFPGLENSSTNETILQPVLGWYEGSELTGWSIASWNCCPSGIEWHSSLVGVNPGDTILGTIESTCSAGTLSCSTWNIRTKDVSSGESTMLGNTPSEGQTFNWAFAGVLEVYSVQQCSDYPPNNSLTFSGLALYDYNFDLISNPGWSITSYLSGLTPQCNYGGQVAPTQVTLDYGKATARVNPTSLIFSPSGGCNSGPKSTTLTNNGPSGLAIFGVDITGPFSLYSANDVGSCPSAKALSAGQSCDVVAVYHGGSGGGIGTVHIYDSATNSPQVVSLIGIDIGICVGRL